MAKFTALALLFCSASALTEELTPLREVSPEEFHTLVLKQEREAPPAKRNLIKQEHKKYLTEAEKKAKREAWLASKDQKQADNNMRRHVSEEEMIMQDEKVKEPEKVATDATKREEEVNAILKSEVKLKVDSTTAVEDLASVDLAKANKTYACREKGSQILGMYLSGLQIANTKHNQAKEKCLQSQLAQHCMPFEKFDVTYVEPCDSTDAACLQRRVLQEHPDCINRNVDWEAIGNYAEGAQRHPMEVLGMWCSHIKVLKEIKRRVTLDEEFVKDYPAILMLEDHVMLDKEWTEEVTKDWVNNYHKSGKNWDMVLLDTHGGKAHTDKVGEFRGKAIYRPSWKANYGGFHAVLLNTKSVATLLEKMQSINVVPIEWVAKSINDDPKGLEILSWESGVSTVEWQSSAITKDYFLPKDCKKVFKDEEKTRKHQ